MEYNDKSDQFELKPSLWEEVFSSFIKLKKLVKNFPKEKIIKISAFR